MTSNSVTAKRLITDIISLMTDRYTESDGTEVIGQAVSFLRSNLTTTRGNMRWKGLPRPADFEELLEDLGFRVFEGRNTRGQKARVVAYIVENK